MYALPRADRVAKDENLFEVVRLKDLLSHYEELDHIGSFCGDCVQALTSFLESKIHLLMDRIQSNCFELEVFCDEVSLDNETLINTICYQHQPFTTSWSNVCDYIDPCAFHKIASKCSRGNKTIHFGYSMNWPMEVKCAFVGDFCL